MRNLCPSQVAATALGCALSWTNLCIAIEPTQTQPVANVSTNANASASTSAPSRASAYQSPKIGYISMASALDLADDPRMLESYPLASQSATDRRHDAKPTPTAAVRQASQVELPPAETSRLVPRQSDPEISTDVAVPSTPDMSAPDMSTSALVQGYRSVVSIDLGKALQDAGVDNPTIALAHEQVRQRAAEFTLARAMILPSLNGGVTFHLHRGNLQASPGLIRSVDSQSLYLGGGARSWAAETVGIPGVRLFAHLGDAILEPQAARREVSRSRWQANAAQNDTLLRVATAYLQLSGLDAKIEMANVSEIEIGEVVRLTKASTKAGQGLASDTARAQTHLQLLHRRRQALEGELASVSASLAGLINADPSVLLIPESGPLVPVALIDENYDQQTYINQALASRPERQAQMALVQKAGVRVRQEQLRPWLPTVTVGVSGGTFGGGSNLIDYRMANFDGRVDLDAMFVWNMQNAGVGNAAHRRRASAVQLQAMAGLVRIENQIRSEVSESLASVQSARLRMDAADKAMSAAYEGSQQELKRIRSQVSRTIEVMNSFQQLLDARLQYVEELTQYNINQFRLWVALGKTPVSNTSTSG